MAARTTTTAPPLTSWLEQEQLTNQHTELQQSIDRKQKLGIQCDSEQRTLNHLKAEMLQKGISFSNVTVTSSSTNPSASVTARASESITAGTSTTTSFLGFTR
jgi:hypothetical protein